MATETVTIGGIPLVYDIDGEGPPLVFLHGGNASAVYWEALVPAFIDRYTCIRLDARGHGRSGRSPERAYGLRAFTDECTAFLDQVTGPATVVGWSLGAGQAFATAARRADLVRAIYSEDLVPRTMGRQVLSGSPIAPFFQAVRPLIEEKQRSGQSTTWLARKIADVTIGPWRMGDGFEPDQVLHWVRFAKNTDAAVYDMTLDMDAFPLPDADVDEIIAKVRCPVHVAYGEPGLSLVTAEDIAQLKMAGMEVTGTCFPGLGHQISSLRPRAFIADLEAFLTRVAAV